MNSITSTVFLIAVIVAITSRGAESAAILAAAPAGFVTAHSSQVVARNYNGLAFAPAVAAPLVAAPAVAAPAVAAPYVAAPAVAAPYVAAPAAAPFVAYNPYNAYYA